MSELWGHMSKMLPLPMVLTHSESGCISSGQGDNSLLVKSAAMGPNSTSKPTPHCYTFLWGHRREEEKHFTSSAYSLRDCSFVSADGWHKDKNGPLRSEQNYYIQTAQITSAVSLGQESCILWLRGSLHAHLSSPNFCHSWGNVLINESFTKGWVCHQSNALFVWMRSWMVCLTTFTKRCSPVLSIFPSNKDALPNVLPQISQAKTSTLPQGKNQHSND